MSTEWKSGAVSAGPGIGDPLKDFHRDSKGGNINTKLYGDDEIVGVDEKKLNLILNKIELVEDKYISLFNDLDASIEDVSYFNCSAASNLNKLLNDISINIPTIKNNIVSYKKDLELVKKNFGVIDLTSAAMFRRAGNNIPDITPYRSEEE